MYNNKSLEKYLDDLAARKPVPGGGSACALSAAMGASLISMVINFTLGKPKYEKYQKELQQALKKSESLRKEFLVLLDQDIAAYQSRNVKKSVAVPLKVCRLSLEGIKLCEPLIKKGNINLVSDAAVAAALFEGAFSGGRFNVLVNLPDLLENSFVKKIRRELEVKARMIKRLRQKTEDEVGQIIRG